MRLHVSPSLGPTRIARIGVAGTFAFWDDVDSGRVEYDSFARSFGAALSKGVLVIDAVQFPGFVKALSVKYFAFALGLLAREHGHLWDVVFGEPRNIAVAKDRLLSFFQQEYLPRATEAGVTPFKQEQFKPRAAAKSNQTHSDLGVVCARVAADFGEQWAALLACAFGAFWPAPYGACDVVELLALLDELNVEDLKLAAGPDPLPFTRGRSKIAARWRASRAVPITMDPAALEAHAGLIPPEFCLTISGLSVATAVRAVSMGVPAHLREHFQSPVNSRLEADGGEWEGLQPSPSPGKLAGCGLRGGCGVQSASDDWRRMRDQARRRRVREPRAWYGRGCWRRGSGRATVGRPDPRRLPVLLTRWGVRSFDPIRAASVRGSRLRPCAVGLG